MAGNELALSNKTTLLLAQDAELAIKESARKIMKLTPNGNKMTPDQAAELAVFAFITQLNPFNGECYYMEKVGPVPGIAGYRVKAQEYIRAESRDKRLTPRVIEEYRLAREDEADFDQASGDIAWVCTLTDTVSRDAWMNQVILATSKLMQAGSTHEEAKSFALDLVGPCPSWSSVGVVKASEHFSGNVWKNNQKVEDEYKPEMWDRNERAKKRAAKGCYRKAFPSMYIPDISDGDGVIDSEFEDVTNRIAGQIVSEDIAKKEAPHRTAEQAASDLFGDPV